MKAGKLFTSVCLLLVLALVLGSCGPAATPQAVEVTKIVEQKVEVTKVVQQEVQVMVTPTPAPPNPYRPDNLFEIADKLKAALAGKSAPEGTRLALVANILVPFWTACNIGGSRASAELNVPMIFYAPVKQGDLAAQVSMMESLVADDYSGISFSAISPKAVEDIVAKGAAKGTNFITMDSDSPDSERYIYVGMQNYTAGVAAGEAAKQIIGKGKVMGLVGFATAQNAIERIQGIKDALKGSDIEYIDTLYDDADPTKALSNAETTLTTYPDLAGFITIYSYDGPAAGQAVKAAGKTGTVKIVAFDLEPETQKLMNEGVIQAAIGQRVYFYGYLSMYTLYAMSALGPEATMTILDPYLSGPKKDILDTGVDVVYGDQLQLYKDYLDSIGIASQ
jgi:ribose transport system substrate-binding protein